MNQQLESHHDRFTSRTHAVNSEADTVTTEATSSVSSISADGQQTISNYFAQMEADLLRRAALGNGTPLSTFERTETLREMQAHLLSLIAAYQEIGDDEQTSFASVIAQFGNADALSVDLRRAKARNKIAHVLRKNDHLLPAVLLPAFFYNVSLLLAFLHTTTRVMGEVGGQMTNTTTVPLSWQASLLLPFFCGAINANLSKKWSLLGIFMGIALALGVFGSLEIGFNGFNPVLFAAMQASLVPWLGSACFGILFAHIAKAMRPKKLAA